METKMFRRGDFVCYWHRGRLLLGTITDGWYDGLRYGRLTVKHFSGELWPLEPCAIFVRHIE